MCIVKEFVIPISINHPHTHTHTHDKNGYDNNAILLRYDKSLGLYGLSKPTFPNCSSPEDQFVEDQIHRFNYILKKVLSGSPIPEKLFQTFAERGIDLPKHFFTHFVRDQEVVQSEV